MGETAEFLINVGWHVTILSIVLVAFFYFYISKLTSGHVQDEVDDVLESKLPQLLDHVQPLGDGQGVWGQVALVSQRMKGFYKEDDMYTSFHNKTIMLMSVAVLIFMLTCMIFISYIYKDRVNLGLIAKENTIIFLIIGMLEYLFFTRISSKIVPVFPDEPIRAVRDAIKKDLDLLS